MTGLCYPQVIPPGNSAVATPLRSTDSPDVLLGPEIYLCCRLCILVVQAHRFVHQNPATREHELGAIMHPKHASAFPGKPYRVSFHVQYVKLLFLNPTASTAPRQGCRGYRLQPTAVVANATTLVTYSCCRSCGNDVCEKIRIKLRRKILYTVVKHIRQANRVLRNILSLQTDNPLTPFT